MIKQIIHFGTIKDKIHNCSHTMPTVPYRCRCQNRRISGRGPELCVLGSMVTRDRDTMFTQVRALLMEVIPCLINYGGYRVDLPRDHMAKP